MAGAAHARSDPADGTAAPPLVAILEGQPMTRPMIPIEAKMSTIDMTTGEETAGTTTMFMMPAAPGL